MPEIWNDAPGRIVLVALSHDGCDPFAAGTTYGDELSTLLGGEASHWFASAAVCPPVGTRSLSTPAYGAALRNHLGERRVILVGREVCDAFAVPASTPLIWDRVPWRMSSGCVHMLAPLEYATLPPPGRRSSWWNEHYEVAEQWLREQAGIE